MNPTTVRLCILSLGMLLGTILFGCDPFSANHTPGSEPQPDALRVDSLLSNVRDMVYTDRSVALTQAFEGLEEAKTLDLDDRQNQFLGEIGRIFSEELDYDQAHLFFDRAIALAREREDSTQLVQWLGEKGYAYLYAGQDSGAMRAFSQALLLTQQMKDISEQDRFRLMVPANIDLAQLYATLLEFQQADQYLEEVKDLLDQLPDSTALARMHEAAAFRFLNQGMYEGDPLALRAAIQEYRNSNELYREVGSLASIPPNYLNMVAAYQHLASLDPMNDAALIDSARMALDEFLYFTDAPQTVQYQLSGLHALASLQASQGDPDKARQTLQQILVQAETFDSQLDSAYAYWMLAELSEEAGQLDSTIFFLKEYEGIAGRVRDVRSDKALRFAQARFQTEKKELENLQIRTESRQRLQLTIGGASMLLFLLLGATGYYFQRQKHHRAMLIQQAAINQQTIIDLIKEQSIESLNARLEGQEKERRRIARELHDHLGGTLAAAKISLEGMKNHLPGTARSGYQNTITLLQNAYLETRQLSHDMMALPLKDLGLDASFRSLCQTINQSKNLNVSFDSHSTQPFNLHTGQELHLYRILQELLQNVIKHAHATQVTVQLTGDDELVTLLVEDNGKGFPQGAFRKGMGLSNIQDRVGQLSGTLDIDSQPGNGSTIIIQFPVSP